MVSTNDLETRGFKLPKPDDAISLGADAITTNAKAAYNLVANDFVQRLKPQAGSPIRYTLNGDAETQAVVIEQPGLVQVVHPEAVEWIDGEAPNLSTKAGDVIYLAFIRLTGTRYLGFALTGLDKTNEFIAKFTAAALKFPNYNLALSSWLDSPPSEIGVYVTPEGDSNSGFKYTFSDQISHVIPKGGKRDDPSTWVAPTPEKIAKAGKRGANVGIVTAKTFPHSAAPFGVSVTKNTGKEMLLNLAGLRYSYRFFSLTIKNGNYWRGDRRTVEAADLKVPYRAGDTVAVFCDHLKFTALLKRAGAKNWQVISEFTYSSDLNDSELKVSLGGDGEFSRTEFWEMA